MAAHGAAILFSGFERSLRVVVAVVAVAVIVHRVLIVVLVLIGVLLAIDRGLVELARA